MDWDNNMDCIRLRYIFDNNNATVAVAAAATLLKFNWRKSTNLININFGSICVVNYFRL